MNLSDYFYFPPLLIESTVIAFGLLVGSFANVAIHRLPLNESVVRPRSRCPHCKKLIHWYDNVPVLSYLILRGKCRSCKASVSPRYPIVEAITALLFYAAFKKNGLEPHLLLRDWPWLASLVIISFIDLQHRIIPDVLSVGGFIWVLACSALFPLAPPFGFLNSLMGAGLGFGLFYGTAVLFEKIRGQEGLGGGDIKLLAMLGAMLGWEGTLATILISSVLGSIIGLTHGLILREKQLMKSAIPFGPFLALGSLIYYFLGDIWFQFMKVI